MTRAEVIVEYYGLTLLSLMQDAMECTPRRDDHEPDPVWWRQMCEARKLDQQWRAIEAGVLPREPGDEG